MTLDIGFNFRATVSYVTDPTGTQFVGGPSVYPTIAGGVTFGWDSTVSSANRSTSVDHRLAGINYYNPAAGLTTRTFRVDLPSAGSYDIHLAIGDTGGGAHGEQYFLVLDDATTLYTIDDTGGVADGHWDDANIVDLTATTWPTNETAKNLAFSSTVFNLQLGGKTGLSFQVLSHLRVVTAAAGGGATVTPQGMMMGVGF